MKKSEIRNLILEIFIFLLAFFGINELYLECTYTSIYKCEYTALLLASGIILKFVFRRNRLLNESLFGLVTYIVLLLEILGLMIFAQYHLIVAVLICLALVFAYIYLPDIILKRTDIRKFPSENKKAKRRYKEFSQSVAVIITCIVLIVPSIVGVYNESNSQILSDEEWAVLCEIFSEDNEEKSDKSKLPKEQQKILDSVNCWSNLDKKERITLLYEIALWEKNHLGLSDDFEITTSAEKMNPSTLAYYSDEDNSLHFSVEHICEDSALENITTVCHEMFHAMEYTVINSLDFESDEVKNNYYYQQAREWYINSKNYKSASYSGFDSYYSQPLEVSAREYALKRSNEYMQMANGLKEIDE